MSGGVVNVKKRYLVKVGLSYPTDPRIVARLLKGEAIPMAARGMKRAEPGAVVDDVPAVSVPWLLAQGQIEEVGGG